jgi:hypothetical protein
MKAFAIASCNQLTRGDASLIRSPFNIAAALSMALGGAGGQAESLEQSSVRFAPSAETGPSRYRYGDGAHVDC